VKCPKCQENNKDTAKFCNDCGRKLPNAEEIHASNQYKPQDYTPSCLTKKILLSRSALEGERKQVTVLFADMKDSMEMLAGRDPEEARKILDPVLELMMEAVHHYEGTVNQVMGDGIMALFGAPLTHEDHAVRACYAALRMQEAIVGFAEELHRSRGMDIKIRVGLHSGEVIVRSIGNDLHMDYTAVGQTTHLAARMEQLAAPGSIRITAETLRLAEGYIQVNPLGPISVKGLANPIEIYEVTEARTVRTRLQPSTIRGLSRFVGRDVEMVQLQEAFEKAAVGHGQVVAVVGEPGVGKSRLFYEFAHSRRTRGWLVLEAGSFSYGKASVYLPVIGLLKAYFHIHQTDDHQEICKRVTDRLLALDPVLEATRTAFLALFDAPDEEWKSFDPLRRRQQTLEVVKTLLIRESQRQPLLLVFEDLHWIDGETRILLDRLIEKLPAASILLLVNYRPEYHHDWGRKTYYQEHRLDTLQEENAVELMNALLGEDATLGSLKRHLIERTGGNPLFLEESVRMLAEMKALEGKRGAYRLVGEAQVVQVPATVQAILAGRIDRLPPEEKRLLQAAAVIGMDVPFPLLNEIAEAHDEDLRPMMAHLQEAGFLYEKTLFPELEYTFKHALTHEVAYGSLLQDRRVTLHGAIVEALERLYPDRMTEQVERLALHAFRGELWDKATRYLQKAGRRAELRSANREAATYFEQALAALNHRPVDQSSIMERINLHLHFHDVLFPLVELKRDFSHLQEAEKLARSVGDQRRLGWALILLSHHFWGTGEIHQAVDACEQARSLITALGDFDLDAALNFYLSMAYSARGDYGKAIHHARRSINACREKLKRLPADPQWSLLAVISLNWLSISLGAIGQIKEGILHAAEELEIAKAANHLLSLVHAYDAMGCALLTKGDFPEAIEFLKESMAIYQKSDLPFMQVYTTASLGRAYALTGHLAEGLQLIKEAEDKSADLGMMHCHTRSLVFLAEACLLAGQIKEAAEAAERSLHLSRKHGTRSLEGWALHRLGEASSHPQSLSAGKAQDYYRQAMALAEGLGMRPLVAHCHLGLGRLYTRMGNKADATKHLTIAADMFRDMEMTFWLKKTEEALAGHL